MQDQHEDTTDSRDTQVLNGTYNTPDYDISGL
jgi:hypothetical protein